MFFTNLVLSLVPSSQVTEQEDQLPQGPTSQSTEGKHGKLRFPPSLYLCYTRRARNVTVECFGDFNYPKLGALFTIACCVSSLLPKNEDKN